MKDIHQFEKGRIKALQDERVYIQKKTFTKWANAFLEKVNFIYVLHCDVFIRTMFSFYIIAFNIKIIIL